MNSLKPPYKFQERGRDMIVRGATYLMHDMGVGKTRTVIMAILKLGIPVMVVAPLNAALITWPDQLSEWAPELSYVVLHGPNKDHYARTAHNYDVVIINYDGLPWWYEQMVSRKMKARKYMLVCDESSLIKNMKTKRWEILAEAGPIWSGHRINMSGTPMPHTLLDLWSQYFILDGGKRLFMDYWLFRTKYFDEDMLTRTVTLKPGSDLLIYDRIRDITDRMDERDFVELPKEVHNDIKLDLPKALRAKYETLEQEFILEFPDGISVANSSGVLQGKLRQFLQGAQYLRKDIGSVPDGSYAAIHDIKHRALLDMVDANAGNPILAAIQFRFEYELLCKAAGYKIPVIHGATSSDETKRLVQDWNGGSLPLLLAHPKSIAYSLNLQFGGHTIVWVALPWEMDLYKQMIKRLIRPGQRADRVIIHRLMFKNTVDEVIARVLKRRDANQNDLFRAMIRR